MGLPVRGSGPPLPGRNVRREPEVVRPKVEAPLDVVLCAARWEAYYVHPMLDATGERFVRSELCLGKTCPHSHHAFKSRWVAFIAAWRLPDKARVVVTLSPEAARSLDMVFRGKSSLYGCRINLERQGGADNGLVTVRSVYADYFPALPEAFPCGPSLQVLFRLPDWPERLVDYAPGDERGEQ